MTYLLLFAICIAIVTWFLLSVLVYGHKAQIKRLWKEIFRYTSAIAQLNMKDDSVANLIMGDAFNNLKNKKDRAGNLINALLDYHYTDTEDEDAQEYAKNQRYRENDKNLS